LLPNIKELQFPPVTGLSRATAKIQSRKFLEITTFSGTLSSAFGKNIHFFVFKTHGNAPLGIASATPAGARFFKEASLKFYRQAAAYTACPRSIIYQFAAFLSSQNPKILKNKGTLQL
jgi:hypothetical protein